MSNDFRLPWRVVENWRGKLAIVDCSNDGKNTTSGRVLNLPRGKNDRGVRIAEAICEAMNRYGKNS